MNNRKKGYIYVSDIYGPDGMPLIIGYDSTFWDHCIDINKDEITLYSKKDDLHELNFLCPKGHSYSTTPKKFFQLKNHCPICLSENDSGAKACDPELAAYYHDDRYTLYNIYNV